NRPSRRVSTPVHPLRLTSGVSPYQSTDTVMQRPTVDPKQAAPLWRQIEDGVRGLVGSGAWPAGAAVPSVRSLAAELLINPATVSKAYQRLVEAGVLVIRRGEGTFVATRPPTLTRAARLNILRDAADRYAALASTIGAEPDEGVRLVRDAFDR